MIEAPQLTYYFAFPGWIPFLIFYFIWLYRRRPFRRKVRYEFRRLKFHVDVRRW
jgi:hypothetical protein